MTNTAHEIVLLGQAGYAASAIRLQVERLCNSPAFDKQPKSRTLLKYLVEEALAGRVPHPSDVAPVLGKLNLSLGDSYVRTIRARLQECLDVHFSKYAKPEEIRLEIPSGAYIVFAPRRAADQRSDEGPPVVSILEPADHSEVYARVTVRGRIDTLDPDLRLWLVVLAPDGWYYLQTRISRRSPSFECHTRTGRMQLGAHEGQEFDVLLVAVAADGDYEFHRKMKEADEGFGTRLPTDSTVLASVRVVRRDIRPGLPDGG